MLTLPQMPFPMHYFWKQLDSKSKKIDENEMKHFNIEGNCLPVGFSFHFPHPKICSKTKRLESFHM